MLPIALSIWVADSWGFLSVLKLSRVGDGRSHRQGDDADNN